MPGFILSRKQMIEAHGQRMVLVHGRRERPEHTLMKGLLWALYLPDYPDAKVEIHIGDRYKPDVVQLDRHGDPVFWAEAGKVGKKKIESLARRFLDTHFVIAKWDTSLEPLAEIVKGAVEGRNRTAPFDLIAFPADSQERFISAGGEFTPTFDELVWRQIGRPSDDQPW